MIVCNYCGEEVVNLPPGLYFCHTCERVVEGNTHEEDEMKDKYPGVSEALASIDKDTLDGLSMCEIFALGFLKGREYELKRDVEANRQILQTKYAHN